MNPRFTLNQEVQDGIDFPEDDKNIFYFLMNDEIILNYGPFQNDTLYFDEQAPDFTPITNSNYQFEAPPDEPPSDIIIPVLYRNKTNAQLQGITSNPSTSFGGELLPTSAVSHPSIVGGKVSNLSFTPFDLEVQQDHFLLFPNLSQDSYKVRGDFTGFSIQILSSDGSLHQDLSNENSPIDIDLTSLPNDLFFLEVTNVLNSDHCFRQIIKME